MGSQVSFDDTGKAFLLKDDKELRRAHLLFRVIHHPWAVKIGSRLTVVALRLGLPVKRLIRNTIFRQFCAGEDLKESRNLIDKLAGLNVGSILDFSAEGAGTEADFIKAAEEIIHIIGIASSDPAIPYTCLKLTGIARHGLLEKCDRGEKLNEAEELELIAVKQRLESICAAAEMKNVPIYIDAEESWIQETIDRLTEEMMEKHNKNAAIVSTTLQMYRRDRLDYLKKLIAEARSKKHFLGVKLVRGAYLEKENYRAAAYNYESPIHINKFSTDTDFNLAIDLCMVNIDIITLCAGTHNEASTMYLLKKMKEAGLENGDKRIYSSQLFGMSDHISFNLADAGYNVTKYLPYGPIKTVLPYLIRRAQENSAIAGQMGRELKLLSEEKKRRHVQKQLAASTK